MSVKPETPAPVARPSTFGGWAKVLAPYGFRPMSHTLERKLWDRSFMYFIQLEDLLKVGISKDVEARMEGFRLACPRGLHLRAARDIPAMLSHQTERQVHGALKSHAYGREWFQISDRDALAVAEPVIARAWQAIEALDAAGYDRAQVEAENQPLISRSDVEPPITLQYEGAAARRTGEARLENPYLQSLHDPAAPQSIIEELDRREASWDLGWSLEDARLRRVANSRSARRALNPLPSPPRYSPR